MIRIITGDALTERNDGRFRKGERRSLATEFKPGEHWRKPQPFRDEAWLRREYVDAKRSTGEIAAQFNVTDEAVHFWMRRHGIPRRSLSEARRLRKDKLLGAANPMFGRVGAANPHYIDGSSPERQRLYSQAVGRAFVAAVLLRDGYRCRRCGSGNRGHRLLHAHHVKPWAGNPALRLDTENAITLCRPCHSWVHSNANTEGQFLA